MSDDFDAKMDAYLDGDIYIGKFHDVFNVRVVMSEEHEHEWYTGALDPADESTTICMLCAAIACSCGAFVPDSSGDAGCGNCGADEPPQP